jgi:F-box domain.
MSFSDLPPEMISHIFSFADIEDQNRFSMTCKEYEVYRIQMDLYEFRTTMFHEDIMRILLDIGVSQRRIGVTPEPREVIYPTCGYPGEIPIRLRQHLVMAWMTPRELNWVLFLASYLKPEKIQLGAS